MTHIHTTVYGPHVITFLIIVRKLLYYMDILLAQANMHKMSSCCSFVALGSICLISHIICRWMVLET